ncbi:hypothetical protein ElyMa_002243200 [Elysia marginata]|uniref:Uncharacterized protein n=1 Tax=Elysia marginata TaxID=1093978 RepID=A0AAV4FXJ9_9GAST|nr:hypothetical protein ElyMa_002243200 [Elysia marginata]
MDKLYIYSITRHQEAPTWTNCMSTVLQDSKRHRHGQTVLSTVLQDSKRHRHGQTIYLQYYKTSRGTDMDKLYIYRITRQQEAPTWKTVYLQYYKTSRGTDMDKLYIYSITRQQEAPTWTNCIDIKRHRHGQTVYLQ